jgi:ferredoxin-NADP reductase
VRPAARPLDYAAGQFLFVNFRSLADTLHPVEISLERQVFSVRPGEMANQFHPFSITSAPGDPELRITVKAVGDYTSAIRGLEAGAAAVVEGAYGSFSHRNAGERQIWLAGGIGVTPFLSMARSLGTEGGPAIDFYYCVEHADEALFLDELRAIAGRREDFRIVVVPRDTDGFLTAKRLEEELGDLSAAHTLICGPPAMIRSLTSQLRQHGVPSTQIHSEEFGFAKVGGDDSDERWFDRPALALIPALAVAGLLVVTGMAFAAWMSDEGDPSRAAPAGSDGGRAIFVSAGCGDCHALAAASADGTVGPDLDEARPDAALVREVVTNGRGSMPAFDNELTPEEIDRLAAFVASAGGG